MYYEKLTSLAKGMILNTSRSKQTKKYFENSFYENVYLNTQDRIKIGVALFKPPQIDQHTNFVILLHGVGCNRDEMADIREIKYLNRKNILILIPDYRGFGDSEGVFDKKKVNLDILACCDYLQKEYKATKMSFIGFSLGTAIASEFVRYNSSFIIDHLILIAPFCDLKAVLSTFKIYTLFSYIVPLLTNVIDNELNYDTLSNLEFIQKERVYLFHGSNDKLVPLENSLRIKEKYNCYLKILPYDHIEIISDTEMWEEIGRIIKGDRANH